MIKLTKQEQSGRSMVEMLGVLAIIGVLSITGISGYTTAMNKHRANEILDAASKRAVVISTQLQSGRTNPTLAEFGDDNTVAGATFSTALETQGSDKFVIKFTSGNEPSAEIWAQMQNIAGTTGIVRAYESGRTGLVYNNDLTTDLKASDYNNNENGCDTTKYTWCPGSGLCLEGTGKTCTCSGTKPACKKCNTETGAYDLADTSLNNTQEKCESGQVCNNGACEEPGTKYMIGSKKDRWDNLHASSSGCPQGYIWMTLAYYNSNSTEIKNIWTSSSLCSNCSNQEKVYSDRRINWLHTCRANQDQELDSDTPCNSDAYALYSYDDGTRALNGDPSNYSGVEYYALCVQE